MAGRVATSALRDERLLLVKAFAFTFPLCVCIRRNNKEKLEKIRENIKLEENTSTNVLRLLLCESELIPRAVN